LNLPTFMRDNFAPATKYVSPASYDPLSSFYKTQARHNSIKILKSNKETGGTIHLAMQAHKGKLSPANYDLKLIDNGFKKTTLGLGRGWK